jgi:lipopolysaccharide export system protein LptC
MRDRITAILAVLLLAGLAGVTYWYSQASRYGAQPMPVSREGPDFVISGLTLTQFDAAGRATNRLFAEQLSHFAVDDRAELLRPRFVSLRPDQPQLEIRARSAVIEGSGEQVLMQDNVVVTRAPGPEGEPPMRLVTERLRALPDFERYSTDVAVEVDRGDSIVRSIGMEYDNITRVVRFNQQVRGTIAPADARKADR